MFNHIFLNDAIKWSLPKDYTMSQMIPSTKEMVVLKFYDTKYS